MLKGQRALAVFLALFLLFGTLAFGQVAETQTGLDDKTVKKLRIAASQHDLIQLLIAEGKYEEAIGELSEIYALQLPGEFEEAVLKEILIVSTKLVERKQLELAHRVLDEGLEQIEKDEYTVILLKLKAKIYRDSGNIDRAVETYRQALEIEKDQLK